MAYLIEHQGQAYSPEGKRDVTDVANHNRQVEEREIEWLKTAPDKAFLYVRLPVGYQGKLEASRTFSCYKGDTKSGLAITTFLGTSVASHVVIRHRSYTGFGYYPHTYRRSVECRIFGVRYVGWYMESSGDYCRLRKAKVQQ